MQKYVAYYRVSTLRQGRSGLGLQAQKEIVDGYLRTVSGNLVAEFCEIESGKRNDRPKLSKALQSARVHGAVLVIAKLDRLSRNLYFLAQLVEHGAEFVCCDMPSANQMTIGIMAAVAQGEARMISERTELALAAAKRKGTPLGGNRGKQTSSQLLTANRASAEDSQQRGAQKT